MIAFQTALLWHPILPVRLDLVNPKSGAMHPSVQDIYSNLDRKKFFQSTEFCRCQFAPLDLLFVCEIVPVRFLLVFDDMTWLNTTIVMGSFTWRNRGWKTSHEADTWNKVFRSYFTMTSDEFYVTVVFVVCSWWGRMQWPEIPRLLVFICVCVCVCFFPRSERDFLIIWKITTSCKV